MRETFRMENYKKNMESTIRITCGRVKITVPYDLKGLEQAIALLNIEKKVEREEMRIKMVFANERLSVPYSMKGLEQAITMLKIEKDTIQNRKSE